MCCDGTVFGNARESLYEKKKPSAANMHDRCIFFIHFDENTSGGEKIRRDVTGPYSYRCNESFGWSGMSSRGWRLDPHFKAVARWFFLTLLGTHGFKQMTFEKFADRCLKLAWSWGWAR
jgi:hypothetical protein